MVSVNYNTYFVHVCQQSSTWVAWLYSLLLEISEIIVEAHPASMCTCALSLITFYTLVHAYRIICMHLWEKSRPLCAYYPDVLI